jgi:hypothetical protein
MTSLAIDVVLSGDRMRLDVDSFSKDILAINKSEEFQEFCRKTMAIGVKEQVMTAEAEGLFRTAATVLLRAGYHAREQEIGTLELEAFFLNETTNAKQNAVRVEAHPTTEGEAVQDLSGAGE